MRNDEDAVIRVGASQDDEMCNFYVMYWVNGEQLPADSYCFTDGPPSWSWANFDELSLQSIPESVSLAPGLDSVESQERMLMSATEEELKEVRHTSH